MNGGFYDNRLPFAQSKWASIIDAYVKELEAHGKCSIRRLAMRTMVSNYSARKAIDYHDSGIVLPPTIHRGHGSRGVGSLSGWQMCHHTFLYDLYCQNPAFPIDGYVEEFYRRFGIRTSNSTLQRWFMNISPFKGTMRVTSRYPSARDSWSTLQILEQYYSFILNLNDHRRLVFADEKPMKECDVYRMVRRDPVTGDTPNHAVDSSNSKNRYSILSAVNIKGGTIPSLKAVIIDKCTDSSMFLQFVRLLLDSGVLQDGDVFVLDNCTVHLFGDNIGTQDYLFREHRILMITLAPYHLTLIQRN